MRKEALRVPSLKPHVPVNPRLSMASRRLAAGLLVKAKAQYAYESASATEISRIIYEISCLHPFIILYAAWTDQTLITA
jgi:hypothetical protein